MRSLRPRGTSDLQEPSLSPCEQASDGSLPHVFTSRRLGGDRAQRKPRNEWERIRPYFKQLYGDEDLSLKEVMMRLRTEYGFEATENQFKAKLKKWGIEKKAKTTEMQHIIKIQTRRRQETPSKETIFRIRRRPVEEAKIERFKREHRELSTPSSSTPSVISWRSPSPDGPRPLEYEHQRSFQEYQSSSSSGESSQAANGPSFDPTIANTLLEQGFDELTHSQTMSLHAQLSIPLISGAQRRETFHGEQGSSSMDVTAAHDAAEWGVPSRRPSVMSTTLEDFGPLNQLDEVTSYRNTAKPNVSQSSEILRGLVIGASTFEEKTFNQKRLYEFESLKAEARLQGIKIDYVSGSKEGCDCSFCKIIRVMDFFRGCVKAHATNRLDLGRRPSWLWCISEVTKMILHRHSGSNLRLLTLLTLICYSESLLTEARSFCQAAVLEFRSIEAPTLEHRDICLNLVAYLIFLKHLSEAKELLKIIAGSSFDTLSEFNFFDTHLSNANSLEDRQAILVHGRAACQLHVIRWLEVHFVTAHGICPQNVTTSDFANIAKVPLSDFSSSFCGNHKVYEQYILTGKILEPYGDSYAFPQTMASATHFRSISWFSHWQFLNQNAIYLGVFTSEGEHH